MDIISLAIRVGTGEINRAQGELRSLTGSLNSSSSSAFKLGSVMSSAMTVVAGAALAAASAVGTLTLAYAAQIDDLNDAAEMYGYSVTQISAMKTAAEAAGTSLEDIVKATSRVKREIANGGEAFTRMGISIRDTNGSMKTASTLATEVATKYRDGKMSADQYADAQKAIGKDLDKTAAALKANEDAQNLVNELQLLGIGIVQEAVEATDAFSTAKQKSSLIMDSMGSIMTANVLPAFTVLIEAFNDSYTSGGLVKEIFDSFIGTMPAIVSLGGFLAKAFMGVVSVFKLVGKTVGAAAAQLVAFGTGDFSGAMRVGEAWKDDMRQVVVDQEKFEASTDAVTGKMNKILRDRANGKLTIVKSTSGRNLAGGPGISDRAEKARAAAAKTAADDGKKQEALMERLAGLQTRQSDEALKLAGVDTERIKLAREAETILGQITKLSADEKANRLSTILATYDQNKATGVRIELEKTVTSEQKKQIDQIGQLKQRSDEYIASQREEFADRFKTRAEMDAKYRVKNATSGTDSLIAEKQRELQDSTLKPEDKSRIEEYIATLRTARAESLVSIETFNAEKAAAENSIEEGVGRGLSSYLDSIPSQAETISGAVSMMAKGMEDSLFSFVTTGKANFKDFAISILAYLAKIAAAKAIAGLVGSMSGTPNAQNVAPGSWTPQALGGAWIGGTQFFANGGVVNRATAFGMSGGGLGVMGDAVPEAIMPLQRGADGKLGVRMAGGVGGGNVQTNHITVQSGGSGSKEDDLALAKTISAVIDKKWNENMAKASRPGGMNNRVTLTI